MAPRANWKGLTCVKRQSDRAVSPPSQQIDALEIS